MSVRPGTWLWHLQTVGVVLLIWSLGVGLGFLVVGLGLLLGNIPELLGGVIGWVNWAALGIDLALVGVAVGGMYLVMRNDAPSGPWEANDLTVPSNDVFASDHAEWLTRRDHRTDAGYSIRLIDQNPAPYTADERHAWVMANGLKPMPERTVDPRPDITAFIERTDLELKVAQLENYSELLARSLDAAGVERAE